MERIQHAIAKARAEREAYGEPPSGLLRLSPDHAADARSPTEPPAPATPRPVLPATAQPAAPPVQPAGVEAQSDDDAVVRAWRELPPVLLDRRACQRNHLVALTGGTGAAEVDAIRTRLLQQLKARGARSVAITSPGPACGKSTVAMNLAFSLGRQSDQRTILADVDFRRPNLAKVLGIKERHSFATVLSGASPFADQALRHGDNLALATTHARPATLPSYCRAVAPVRPCARSGTNTTRR